MKDKTLWAIAAACGTCHKLKLDASDKGDHQMAEELARLEAFIERIVDIECGSEVEQNGKDSAI